MKTTSMLLASAFLVGTSNAQCNGETCEFTGAPFQSTCYMSDNVCADCPEGQVNNYFAPVDPPQPSGTSGLDDTTACIAAPQCAQMFGDKYLPWPQWLGVLQNPDLFAGAITQDDVPSFVQLLYGFYGGQYPTANIAESAVQAIIPVDETGEVYVELFPNGADGCDDNPLCQDLVGDAPLPVLNGMKFAVSECTRLMFNGGAVYLQFRSGETEGQVSCDYGMFTGHGCDWGASGGSQIEVGQIVDEGANATCTAFPASQGFQMKIHCHELNEAGESTGILKNFRDANRAILDRALHDSTCREVGRVEFPCQFPAFCQDVATPVTNGVLANASAACETEILSENCTAIQSCLSNEPGVMDLDYYTSCIQNMCADDNGDDSSASIIAGSLAMAFLALF